MDPATFGQMEKWSGNPFHLQAASEILPGPHHRMMLSGMTPASFAGLGHQWDWRLGIRFLAHAATIVHCHF
jgi:hypothetical protein